jgi:predicted nucleotidyltransferase
MVAVKEINLQMLCLVARRLEPLLDRLIFLGGCTTALFITDEAAPDVRVTHDVDVIVEVLSRNEYWQLEERLRELGCTQEIDEEVTCRWKLDGITLDVMPTDESILGFSNRWYSDAINYAETVSLNEDLAIRLVTPAHFIATKLEAFFGRGNDDYWGSHDLEDIVTVIDGRAEILAELSVIDAELKAYIAGTISGLIAAEGFREALSGHLPPDRASQERLPLLWQRLVAVAALA